MRCSKCGAQLLETDTFCVKCGQKVGPFTCPSCGEVLREGTKFCHKCGTQVIGDEPEDDEIPVTSQKTIDIPFEEIEQGILLEAKQAALRHPASKPAVKKEMFSEEEEYDEEEYDDDFEEDDEDEFDEDEDEEGGSSIMSKITLLLGIIIVLILVIFGFLYWKNNRDVEEEEVQIEEMSEQEATEDIQEENGPQILGKLQVIKNVNIRNNPDKDNSKVLGVAKSGETYDYTELINDSWYHILLEDGEGYVYKDYVESLD